MADMSNENLRRFPHYGDRRNKGTNPEETGEFKLPLDYADNIPTEVDLRVDHSQHMNSHIVREFNRADLTGQNRRPTIHGTGLNREELEQYQNDGARSRSDDPDDLDQKQAGFNPTVVRTMAQLALAATDESGLSNDQRNQLTSMGMQPLPAAMSSGGQNPNVEGTWILGHPQTGSVAGVAPIPDVVGLGAFGLHAANAVRWRGTSGLIPAKNLVQLLLTGSVNVSSYEIADVLSFVASSNGAGPLGTPFPDANQDLPALPFDCSTTEGIRKTLDSMTQSMCYTSFLDFVIDWDDAIQNLCLNLPYLKGEFIGFFERGFKSHFWQRFSMAELYLLCWCVQLGMAVRRGAWQRNLHSSVVQTDSDANTIPSENVLGGVWNPFFFRLDDFSYETGAAAAGQHTEWCAPGLLRYIDEMSYETNHYPEPERGIYLEDMLTGLDIIMDEASREAGMAWRSIGRGYMEFFDDFKTGSIVDIRSREARLDTKALRVAQHLGFNDVTPIVNSNGLGPDQANVSWFSSFVTRGGIIETDREKRLVDDINDLSSQTFLTGSKFTAGMQMNGKSQTKVFHRDDLNGNEHSIDITLDPECKMQLVNFEIAFPGHSANSTLTMLSDEWPQKPSFPARPRVTVAWVSSGQGWHVYSNTALHPLSHIRSGAWDTLQATHSQSGYGRGYSHICTLDGLLIDPNRYNSGGQTPATQEVTIDGNDYTMAPMFGEMYYDISPGGWFPAMMRELSVTYERWQEAQSRVPWKSKWSGSSIDGINLISMLSMSTGESLVQTNLSMMLHGGYCGVRSDEHPWRLDNRLIDRTLHDSILHATPARRTAEQVGMDCVAVMLPEGMDASSYLEGLLMLNYESFLMGRLQGPAGGSPARDPAHYATPSGAFGAAEANAIDFYPDIFGNGAGVLGLGSNVRVVYMGEQLLDGTLLNYLITPLLPVANSSAGGNTPMNRARPCFVSRHSGLPQGNLPSVACHLFDFYSEEVYDNATFTVYNAAHVVPGMRQYFAALMSLDVDSVGDITNSPCSVFGLGNTLTQPGSLLNGNAANPTGFAIAPSEVIDLVQAARTHMDTPDRPALTAPQLADIVRWDTELWMEYVAARRGVEFGGDAAAREFQSQTLLYNKTIFSVLMIDQDVYDTFNNLMAVNLFWAQRQLLLHSTAHAVLDKAGNVSYSGGVYTIGSGGGVASGSTFDESDVQSTTETIEES